MGHFFDFGNIKNNERTIRKTWDEFRDALAMGNFHMMILKKRKNARFLRSIMICFMITLGLNIVL